MQLGVTGPSGQPGRRTSARGSLVVVNYGSSALIEANLTPEAVTASGCAVIVVDNYSEPAHRVAIARLCAERGWHLVARDTNEGFGAGVNRGVDAAAALGATVFVVLNPDAVADGRVLADLVRDVGDNPSRIIAPLIMTSTGGTFFRGAQVSLRTGRIRTGWSPGDDDPEWRNWLTGACLVFSLEAYKATGGMDEGYFLYWEDVDLSRRAADLHFELAVRSDLVIIHDEGGTHGDRPANAKSPIYYYYNTRNRLLFGARHAPAARSRWLAATPAESLRIWLRGGRRQLLTQPAGVWAAVRGSFAGMAALAGGAWPTGTSTHRVRTPGPAAPLTVLVTHPSPDLYGSDRVLIESVAGFIEAGHRVVVALPKDGPLVAELERHGCEVVMCPTPVLRKSALSPRGLAVLAGETLRAWPNARRLIHDLAPDLVFVNTITNSLWLAAARGGDRHIVCHVHEAERSAHPVVRKCLYAPLLLADHLLVNSQFTLDVLADSWPVLRPRADIVANGVPGPIAPMPPRADLTAVNLLFIGRLSPRKGPQVALAALEQLLAAGRPVHLTLLGAVFPGYEWFEADLRDFVARRGLAEHVTFLGFDPDVWGHLAASDIVLVPSTVDEPFGNTAVEAMLAERPLVVSATSGLLEAAADYATARRVAPGEPDAIAAAVIDLADDWAAVIAEGAADRRLALSRHGPEVYRRTLVRSVAARRSASQRKGRTTA